MVIIMFHWKKLGKIISIEDVKCDWAQTHVQLPIPYELDSGEIRLFFNSRQDGIALPTYVDLDPNTLEIKYVNPRPLLSPGRPGTFDDRGVMFSSVLKVNDKMYAYYSGWNVPSNVCYHNSVGLAVSEDDGKTFKKPFDGPVMDRSIYNPIFVAAPYVIKDNDSWLMYFLSCSEWIQGEEKVEPVYDIHYAKSKDGIHWNFPRNNTCITGENESIAQPCVVKNSEGYHMWYSYRKTLDYRKNKNNSYRIGYAFSKDGMNWVRKDNESIVFPEEEGWDSQMVAYSYVFHIGSKYYMFYNGNDFGQSGIGCAICTIGDESK